MSTSPRVFGDGEDVTVTVGDDHVAVVEMHRPPNNFFDLPLIRALADAYEALDEDTACRALVLCSEGKHFCAGADFNRPRPAETSTAEPAETSTATPAENDATLYHEAIRLFEARKPVVAAVQGGAIGGGLGLACSADFRVASPESRFTANFARLGFHHGFGLSVTLPGVVGRQHALDLLYRGRRIGGDEAARFGLVDQLAPATAEVRAAAHALAADIAASAPLSVESIRQTMRGDLAGLVRKALDRELSEQKRLLKTEDAREGIRATAERRAPEFQAR
jgi:enoyl-CoA hydratase/carnithine racemase